MSRMISANKGDNALNCNPLFCWTEIPYSFEYFFVFKGSLITTSSSSTSVFSTVGLILGLILISDIRPGFEASTPRGTSGSSTSLSPSEFVIE